MAIAGKRERLEAALAGESLDRVPVALWGHDYRREWTLRGLVDSTVEDFERYDWDFVKITPRTSYQVEDWRAQYVPSGTLVDPPRFVESPIRMPRDLENLDLLRFDRGVLEEHLQVVRSINRDISGQAFILQTIHCPLAVLAALTGSAATVKEWLATEPHHVRTGLEAITETYAAYSRECLEAGAAGIFYDTGGWAGRDGLAEAAYQEFGRAGDERIFAAVRDGRFNVLSLPQADCLFNLFLDAPVQALHWASQAAGNPSLDEGRDRLKDRIALMGGLASQPTLLHGTPADVERAVRDAIERTERYHVVLAPEGDVPPGTLQENREAVGAAVRRL